MGHFFHSYISLLELFFFLSGSFWMNLFNPVTGNSISGWWLTYPSEKMMWFAKLGWWHSQHMESHKTHVPNHQPDKIHCIWSIDMNWPSIASLIYSPHFSLGRVCHLPSRYSSRPSFSQTSIQMGTGLKVLPQPLDISPHVSEASVLSRDFYWLVVWTILRNMSSSMGRSTPYINYGIMEKNV